MLPFKTRLHIFYIYCIPLLLPPGAHTQPLATDTLSINARATLQTLSAKAMGSDLRLYTGAEYVRNGLRAVGNPFFQSEYPLDGSLVYDGATYDHIPIQYDLVTDEVFIHDTIADVSISLIKDKLPRFTISGHTFTLLQGDSPADLGSKKFYEILCDGPYPLYGRYDKKLIFPTNREDTLHYTSFNMYFLRMHDRYLRIEGQRSLLNALSDKKDELKKYIRHNKPDFKRTPSTAYAMIVNYYTQLKN